MKKNIIITFILTITCLIGFSQDKKNEITVWVEHPIDECSSYEYKNVPIHIVSKSWWKNLCKRTFNYTKYIKESTLLIALDNGNDSLNDVIKSTIKKYWTFCEYEFISTSELSSYYNKTGYSVLTFVTLGEGSFKHPKPCGYTYEIRCWDKPISSFNHANRCFVFDLPALKDYNVKRVVACNHTYLIPIIIKSFQNRLVYFYNSKGELQSDFYDSFVGKQKNGIGPTNGVPAKLHYSNGETLLPKMKLLVCNEGFADKEKIKTKLAKALKIDENKIEIVEHNVIAKAISEEEENTAVLTATIMHLEIYSVKDATKLAYWSDLIMPKRQSIESK